MERKSSKEYSVVFLVEGEKFKLQICLRGLHLKLSVLLRTRSAQRKTSQHLTAVLRPNLAELVPSGFLVSTTMVYAAVLTHFPKKNTCVYRNTVTCITRVTSNWVEVHRLNSQHLAMGRTTNMTELVPSSIFCLKQRSINNYLSIKMYSRFDNLAEIV